MKNLKNIAISTVLATSVVLSPLAGLASAAGNGTVDLSMTTPNNQTSFNVGDQLAVSVYEDSGTGSSNDVTSMDINVDYPVNLLQFVSASSSPSFDTSIGNNASGGVVYMTRANSTPQTGKQLVGVMTFKAIAGGTANLTFDNSSQVTYTPPPGTVNTTQAQLNKQNASYTIVAPSTGGTGGTGGGSGGGGGSSTGSGGTSSSGGSTSKSSGGSSSTSKPALTISKVAVSKTTDTATVTWQTSAAASSEVDYGTSKALGFSAVDNNRTTNHSLKLQSKYLQTGQTYYFTVKSVDANGTTAVSPLLTFQMTPGTDNVSLNQPASQKTTQKSASKGAAIAAVVVIALLAILGAVTIRRIHRRAIENQELSSHVVAPGTSVINGNVTVTPDPKQVPPNKQDGPKVG